MYKKEIERKFLVNRSTMPNVKNYPCIKTQQGYLSGKHDLLEVRIRHQELPNGDNLYNLILKDYGTKVRNEITYNISKEEYDATIILCGNKIINKNRYLIPNSEDISIVMELDVYKDIDLIVCEYENDNELKVDTLPIEKWFIKEITDDPMYKNANIAMFGLKK